MLLHAYLPDKPGLVHQRHSGATTSNYLLISPTAPLLLDMASSTAGPSTSAAAESQMAAPQWRQFTFFDVEEVKDGQDLASSPRVLRVGVLRTHIDDYIN
jgi:hypothetical protein